MCLMTGTDTNLPLIELRDIRKSFNGKIALNGVDLTLNRGEILGLVGDNGAGKSTLLKILAGFHAEDQGGILINGKAVHISSPRYARDLGIEMVYQDLSLCGNMTIWENIFLGRYDVPTFRKRRIPFLKKSSMALQAKNTLMELGLNLKTMNQPVHTLSGGEQQAVAMSRCLLFHPNLILLDEPTASMALWEKKKILELMEKLRNQGRSIIVVTHNLHEIFEVADRVLVLKQGQSIWCGQVSELTPETLAQRMFVGKE